MSELTETAVARRVPSLTDERLRVLSRRQPVTVPPGTSLAECLRAIQRTGTGDSVFVCDTDGVLRGVLGGVRAHATKPARGNPASQALSSQRVPDWRVDSAEGQAHIVAPPPP